MDKSLDPLKSKILYISGLSIDQDGILVEITLKTRFIEQNMRAYMGNIQALTLQQV